MFKDKPMAFILIFFGGGFGCLIRYLSNLDGYHPFMPANIAACVIVGVVYCLTRYKILLNEYVQAFVNVGFLGGLSTFTPIATFALIEAEDSMLTAFVLFTLYMLLFIALALTGYFPTALYCRKILKIQAIPSVSHLIRAQDARDEAVRQQQEQDRTEYTEYQSLIKSVLEAGRLMNTLKQQIEVLKEMAPHNPEAAAEYRKATEHLKQLQDTLLTYKARIEAMKPMVPKNKNETPATDSKKDTDSSEDL